MDIQEIKQLIDLISKAQLSEFEIEEKGLKLRICRKVVADITNNESKKSIVSPSNLTFTKSSLLKKNNDFSFKDNPLAIKEDQKSSKVLKKISTIKLDINNKEKEEIIFIKSPMVGTFYSSASPDSNSFVTKGSIVNSETIVCIIEAMKVMNEICAEISGTIVEVLVKNGEAIEFGKPLFKIKRNIS